MTIENATTIGTLDPTLPTDNDGKVEGAGQIRLLKIVLQATQNATLAATANGKVLANAEFVQNAIMRAVLAPGVIPNQTGNAGKALVTDGTSATWGFVGLVYEARSAAAQIVKGDNSKFLDLTGTFTQAFDTPANLGVGWNLRVRNNGTGDITIPASDGVTNWIMYPGEVRDFNCDGTTLRSVVLQSFQKIFTSSGNFIRPPGYAAFSGLIISGGAGGTASWGGGGGGAFQFNAPFSALLATNTVTVSAGSAAGAMGGTSAFAGFQVLGGSSGTTAATAYGGSISQAVASNGSNGGGFGGGGFQSSTGNGVYGGGSGGNGGGGNSLFGGGGGGISAGGASAFAGVGGAAGIAGSIPGGGGGTNAAGARGEVRIGGVL